MVAYYVTATDVTVTDMVCNRQTFSIHFRANPKNLTHAHLSANLLGTPKNVRTDKQTFGQKAELGLCHGLIVDLLDAIAQGDLMTLTYQSIRVYTV